jgi:hypothetical protein
VGLPEAPLQVEPVLLEALHRPERRRHLTAGTQQQRQLG